MFLQCQNLWLDDLQLKEEVTPPFLLGSLQNAVRRGGFAVSDKIFVASKVSQLVTDRIISKLERGIIPWRQSWSSSGLPVNWETKRPYSGVNLLLLDPGAEYLTFNQIKKLGARLKKGAKALPVVFWKIYTVEREKPSDKEQDEHGEIQTVEETEKNVKTVYLLRYYLVYNVEDVEGLPKQKRGRMMPDNTNRVQKALNIAKEWNKICEIRHGNYEPSYSPVSDTIYMPSFDRFCGENKIEEYFSTLFHEIIHSTGHVTRLNRIHHKKFGDWHYSLEELTAEIGSTMLLNICDLDVPKVFDNNVAYINYWLERLRNDKTLVVKAAGRAQKAVEYVLEKVKFKEEENSQVQQATA